MITRLLAAYFIFVNLSAKESFGIFKGTVIDQSNKSALIGATVSIQGTPLGAVVGEDGSFRIDKIKAGSYTVKVEFIGYQPIIKTDIIIKPNRITAHHFELKESTESSDEVVVTAGYFQKKNDQPISIIGFSNEEIRRAPGSAGDVSRIIMGLPSIAKVNDQSNSLIVRGGSPTENGFYVDNIEIPNINHFPTQGSSGGPISLINVDLIDNVNFYSGGFTSTYGSKLSSIMELKLREGNREEFDGQLDLNFAGFGGVFEGPISTKGSWLVSARRSYIDLMAKHIDLGTTVAPQYSDYQMKVVYDLSPKNRLNFIGIFGDDHNNPDRETAIENDMTHFGNQDIYEGTIGLNLRTLWDNGYSNTSISYTKSSFDERFKETHSNKALLKNDSEEEFINIRNVNHFELSDVISYKFGFEAKFEKETYNNIYYAFTDVLGNDLPERSLDKSISNYHLSSFLQFQGNILSDLSFSFGSRIRFSEKTDNVYVSPRASLSYSLSNKTKLNLSSGIFYQPLPSIMVALNNENKELNEPKSVHYIAGFDHLLTESTQLKVEAYLKEYFDFPVNPKQRSLFVLDEIVYSNGFFFAHEKFVDTGRAQSIGIEFTLQKKLAENIYGLASLSLSKSRYKDGSEKWIDRVFDNQFTFSLEGGYKPNNKWEFSTRWIYAGAPPVTPIDIERSKQIGRTTFDESKINTARYSDYHSLNIRFDRRFNYSSSNIVFYVSIWNVYNQKNIATKTWNNSKQEITTIYQWNLLPIFGLEYEF